MSTDRTTTRDLRPGDVIAWRDTHRTIAAVIDEGQRSIVGDHVLLIVKYAEGGWEYVPATAPVKLQCPCALCHYNRARGRRVASHV